MSKIEVNAIEPQCGTNLTVGASGDTITFPTGTTIVNNGSQTGFGRTGTVDWDTTAKTASFTAVSGNGYFVNTTSGAITLTLPSSPSAGDIVAVADYAGTAGTNNITIARNGSNINGGASDLTVAQNNSAVTLVYIDGTQGWKGTQTSSLSDIELTPAYVVATGGTIVCCGDYKIHKFTGPGTFAVTCAGNPLGSSTLEILAVAAGGGAGSDNGGGGGAGSVAHGTSIPISVASYPITIGGGGAGGTGQCSPAPSPTGDAQDGTTGSSTGFLGNTVRAGSGSKSRTTPGTIPGTYSNGGGGAGTVASGVPNCQGMTKVCGVVHPSISGYTVYAGNSGGCGGKPDFPGNTIPTGYFAGGGAGAGTCQNGSNASPTVAGPGGNGVQINICGSNYYWGGGGGGGTNNIAAGNGGLGGGGGGGVPAAQNPTGGTGGGSAINSGSSGTTCGGAGGANTGGGGGGAARGSPGGGNGGSGILIIKYKYQN